jgi:hypothetical protein
VGSPRAAVALRCPIRTRRWVSGGGAALTGATIAATSTPAGRRLLLNHLMQRPTRKRSVNVFRYAAPVTTSRLAEELLK